MCSCTAVISVKQVAPTNRDVLPVGIHFAVPNVAVNLAALEETETNAESETLTDYCMRFALFSIG